MKHRRASNLRLALAGVALASLGGAVISAAAADAAPILPDLVVNSVSDPPTTISKSFSGSASVANVGDGPAGPSTTVFYLSHDAQLNGDVRVGSAATSALGAGKSTTVNPQLAVPNGTKPGKYYLIACADGAGKVAETSNSNNCRTSQMQGTVPCYSGDQDCDGWYGAADCNDQNASIHPGASDGPDLKFIDSNCDGIDGNVKHAIFVSSTTGNDSSPGTRAAPMRTLGAAVATANAQHKDV